MPAPPFVSPKALSLPLALIPNHVVKMSGCTKPFLLVLCHVGVTHCSPFSRKHLLLARGAADHPTAERGAIGHGSA